MSPKEFLSAKKPDWKKIVAEYTKPDLKRSIRELAVTFGPLLVLTILMYLSLRVSVWLTLALALPTAGFLVRTFIILHDCGHGSFFQSKTANDWVGLICGVLTFTPYYHWRHSHAIHHASSGDLDRRGIGDVMTLTVREYLALPWYRKISYRVYRSPLVLFGIAPLLLFLVMHRFPYGPGGKRERWSVHFTNLSLLALFLTLGYFLGFWNVILVHLPAFALASLAGVWMFYVQHQFEDTYWEHHPEWEYLAASLQGSSYYKLPKVLQWFTGNIGFHHIHHLSPKIPNYNLPKAFKENPIFQHVTVITFWESLRTISLKLWDEEKRVMVGWKYLRTFRAGAVA
ncbi:MAG TPA: fatty acid desaturase [Anaerolineales bacterium]|nr:fatty acid desaturase [Anaerolineales bacterium]